MSISILERERPCCGTPTMLLCFDKLEGGVAWFPDSVSFKSEL